MPSGLCRSVCFKVNVSKPFFARVCPQFPLKMAEWDEIFDLRFQAEMLQISSIINAAHQDSKYWEKESHVYLEQEIRMS